MVPSTSVPLIAGLPGSAEIDTKCMRGGMKKPGRPRKPRYTTGPGRPRKPRYNIEPTLWHGQKQKQDSHDDISDVMLNQDPRSGSAKDAIHSNIKKEQWNDARSSNSHVSTSVTYPFKPDSVETQNAACNNPEPKPDSTSTPTPTKRGRPKGCKDTKKRKPRHDYIGRLVERNENVDEVLKARESIPICHSDGGYKTKTVQRGRPSLMASDKSKHTESHGECRMGSMNVEEIEQIEKRLNTTNPWIIPDHKRELFSLILGEINHRIASQGFQTTLKP